MAGTRLVNCFADSAHSCLYAACLGGQNDVVAMLLDHGADPNLPEREFGNTPLHAAANSGTEAGCDIVRQLIAKGADVNREYLS